MKIHSNDGEGVNPYSFVIDIWSDADENPDIVYPETRFNGTIGPLDSEGDFYLLRVGPGSPLEIEFETTDIIELRYIENGNMTELNQSSGTLRIEFLALPISLNESPKTTRLPIGAILRF